MAAERPAVGNLSTRPWVLPGIDECRESTDGSFDEDGDEAILEPAEYDDD